MMKSRKSSRRRTTDPVLSVELPENLIRAIDRLAHQGRITRSEVIRRLVENGLAAELPASRVERF
jgi:metal-responsive CopG/Arc/MetJ family transcriptional regulator